MIWSKFFFCRRFIYCEVRTQNFPFDNEAKVKVLSSVQKGIHSLFVDSLKLLKYRRNCYKSAEEKSWNMKLNLRPWTLRH